MSRRKVFAALMLVVGILFFAIPIVYDYRGSKETDKLTQEFEADKSPREKVEAEMPEFSVTVTPFEREGSNIRGLARIYFDDSFIVNNVSILQGKDKVFVAMPSYKTKQTDEQGKAVYQDVCYPVTKEFREKLYAEIVSQYEKAKEQNANKAKEVAQTQATEQAKDQYMKVDGKELPFR